MDELEDVIDIIIKSNNGSIEKITYNIPGFKDPLIRKIRMSDSASAERFIKNINEKSDKKEYLTRLYSLSQYRETTICASGKETLEKITQELKEKGYVYNE